MHTNSLINNKFIGISSRILVGLLFVFSGFVKSVDPTGSAIKFGEYFLVLHLGFLEPASLIFAVLLCGLEFLVGISLLFNIKTKLNSWAALLFMAIFTILTLYSALSNAVTDCGCFGDFIKLSNWGTFYKNIVIDLFVIILFLNRKNFNRLISNKIDWLLFMIIVIFAFGFNNWNIQHSPVIDFRPFKIGTYIPDAMKIPEGKAPDKYGYDYTLQNTKTKAVKVMTSDDYLSTKIWEDSTWQITKTSEPRLIKEGYKPAIHDLRMEATESQELTGNTAGQNILDSVLNDPNYSIWILSIDINKANPDGMQRAVDLTNLLKKNNLKAYCLTSSGRDDIRNYRLTKNPPFYFYNTDQTTIKTIERSNPAFVLLKKGTIIAKWHFNEVPTVQEFETKYLAKN